MVLKSAWMDSLILMETVRCPVWVIIFVSYSLIVRHDERGASKWCRTEMTPVVLVTDYHPHTAPSFVSVSHCMHILEWLQMFLTHEEHHEEDYRSRSGDWILHLTACMGTPRDSTDRKNLMWLKSRGKWKWESVTSKNRHMVYDDDADKYCNWSHQSIYIHWFINFSMHTVCTCFII